MGKVSKDQGRRVGLAHGDKIYK